MGREGPSQLLGSIEGDVRGWVEGEKGLNPGPDSGVRGCFAAKDDVCTHMLYFLVWTHLEPVSTHDTWHLANPQAQRQQMRLSLPGVP